ncbi:MAG: hypothetical protein ABL894_11475, partial [Hyphomicrobium sp.]
MVTQTLAQFMFLVLSCTAAVLSVLVLYASFRQSRWGLNIHKVSCPTCGSTLPIVRTPSSVSQALWGGWTCTCGTR